jgi:acetate kinase
VRVLVLNPGSSSLKSSVVETDTIPVPGAGLGAPTAGAPGAAAGVASAPGAATPPDTATAGLDPLGRIDLDWGSDASHAADPAADIRRLLERYEESGISTASIGAVGYRVVHGGERFREPVLVTPRVVEEVEELRSLAPLHNGVAVKTMRAALAAIPDLPHVAVFDTAFHATLPQEAYRYPVPGEWYREWGIRRYGFHGMSVAWSVERSAALLGRPAVDLRLIVAHLGSGCSVTAVDGGRSVATSMGLTPLEGLMMGTRSGSIDPGIMLAMLRDGRLTLEELADQLDHGSGLLGVSGRTSDVRELLALEASGEAAAALALAIFVRRAAQEIAAAATALPVVDAIVFTAGIGENAAPIRARIVDRLGSIGVAPIPSRHVSADCVLGDGPGPRVMRVQAREDLVVARDAARLAGR